MFITPILLEAIQDLLGVGELAAIIIGIFAFFAYFLTWETLFADKLEQSYKSKILEVIITAISFTLVIIPGLIIILDLIILALWSLLQFDGPYCPAFRGDCDY